MLREELTVRELNGKAEMLKYISVIQELYPSLKKEEYEKELDAMLPNNKYSQIAVFEGEKCLGISGIWIGTKLWCGKYLEIDNLVVSSKYRSKGVGKLLFDFISIIAKEEGCSMVSLDSYTANFKAHKFFYNEGFGPKGFHFVKLLNKDMVR